MWHLVQQSPGETVELGTYDNYERAKLVLMNKQRFNGHCFYEILTSEELKDFAPLTYSNL